MAIVVTGGAGRIGMAIVQLLCEQEQPVIVQYHQSEDQARSLRTVSYTHLTLPTIA